MIPGYQTLGSIEDALAQLRAQENDANNRLDAQMRRMADAKADEAEQYRTLARFKLQSGGSTLGARMDQAAMRARAVLALRDNEKGMLDKKLDEAAKAIALNADARKAAGEALEAVEEEKHALIAKSDKAGTYQALREEASRTGIIAAESEKKASLSEAELETKRKPYESDPVFMYLWKNGFSTSAYNKRGITKMLDTWAARLVGFFDARPNYAMLNEIPQRLRDYAGRTAEDATRAAQALEAAQAKAFASAGGEAVQRRIGQARDAISRLEAERQMREQAYAGAQDEIKAFAEGRDPRYQEAVNTIAASLSNQGFDTLYRQARETAEPQDDTIVERIGQAISGQRDAEVAANQARADLTAIGQRRQQMAQVATQFRRARYDVDGSRFDNNVVGSLLQGLVIGALSSSDFWSRMSQGRHTDNGPFGGSWSGDASGGWGGGSSGGDSGGGFSGGGGGGSSDGFSTGGSF